MAALLVAGVTCVFIISRDRGHQERVLLGWIEEYSTNRFPTDKQAELAIRHFGSNATPTLFKLITTRESHLRVKLTTLVPNKLLKFFHIADATEYYRQLDQQRRLGAYGFAALGPEAKSAVPALIALRDDKEERVRYLAVFALRCLGPVADEALPNLIACLTDPEFSIQDEAVAGLGTIHEQPERVVPIIMDFLAMYHTNVIFCSDSIRALGMFGPDAKSAVPILMEYLNDPDATTRFEATNALLKIDPHAATLAGVR